MGIGKLSFEIINGLEESGGAEAGLAKEVLESDEISGEPMVSTYPKLSAPLREHIAHFDILPCSLSSIPYQWHYHLQLVHQLHNLLSPALPDKVV